MNILKKILFYSVITLLISCSSDDNLNSSLLGEGYFEYKGHEYPLKAGKLIEKNNYASGITEYYFELYSSEFSINNPDDKFDIILNDDLFYILGFELNSKNESKPKDGTYEYKPDLNYDYYCSDFYVGYECNQRSSGAVFCDKFISVSKGWVHLTESNGVYDIEFEFPSLFGSDIKGSYKGRIMDM